MTALDYTLNIVISVFIIFGVYQFYFFTQRHCRAPISMMLPLDRWIPFWPSWVWIYSGLYYPLIIYVNLTMESHRQFAYAAISYMVLLFLQMGCFLALPVATPLAWREFDVKKNWSLRFLGLVQAFDKPSNCFPSMHTSVAMLTALHIYPHVGAWAWAFPALISISCLFTKQHFIIDLPAGGALGWLAYRVFEVLYTK